jgi:LAO/AO transport system kinase
MQTGDRLALAKLMTIVENREPETAAIMSAIAGGPEATVIGVTGPPGAGKSTLLDSLTGLFRRSQKKVGIVAVDPSSPFSGGAVLGDRIRMQSHFLDEGVFIRSLSARGNVGGLARASRDVARLLQAAGKDVVIVETVGVGQSEMDIMRLADTVVVVLVPEAGDTVQAMKAGLLEIADIFVVNKADRDGAMKIKTELEQMLHLRPPDGWEVPVLMTVATTGEGVADLVAAIDVHRQHLADSGLGARRSASGRQREFFSVLRDELGRRIEIALRDEPLAPLIARVERGEVDPYGAALEAVADPAVVSRVLGAGAEESD